MSPPQKSQKAYAYNSAPEEKNHLDLFSSCDQSSPYPLESTHLLQDVHDYDTKAIGIEGDSDIKEVQQEEDKCVRRLNRKSLFQRWKTQIQ